MVTFMKKTIYIIILSLLLSLVLSSCNKEAPQPNDTILPSPIPSQNNTESTEQVEGEDINTRTVTLKMESLDQIKIPNNANIIFFDKNYVVYTLNDEQTDTGTQTMQLYVYLLETATDRYVTDIVFPDTHLSVALIYNNCLYVVGSIQGGPNGIHQIDLSTLELRTIMQLDNNAGFVSVYQVENSIILFYISPSSEKNMAYQIYSIDLATLDYSVILKEYVNGEGTCISCICVDEQYIYSYEITVRNGTPEYQIVVYTVDGVVAQKYPLDLSGFITVQNKMSNDSVNTMCKKRDYLVLNTINGRVKVFKIDEKSMYSMQIPQNLYAEIPSGYRLYDSVCEGHNVFIASNAHQPQIYLFDTEIGEFTGISVIAQSEEYFQFISSYEGTAIIKTGAVSGSSSFYLLDLL